MSTPRIFFVNRFYWPDQPATAQLLTDLAEGLVRSGFYVTVIARRPSSTHPLTELRQGVHIQRLRTSAWGRRNLIGRSLDFATFLFGARKELRASVRPRDVVVTMTDPPMLGAFLSTVVRHRGASSIQWVQDIFPEVAIAVSGQKIAHRLVPWRNRAWCAAQRCVVPGEDMAKFLRRQGVPAERLTVSENWSPEGLQPSESSAWRERHGLVGRFLIMYSGNLGRVHDFGAIIPLAQALAADRAITFVFVGEGAQKAALQTEVLKQGLKNLLFLPAQPREELSPALSAGDLHLVTLKAGCEELVFPSKLYGIAAVGRPALVIGPRNCEPSRLVPAHGFGAGYTPDDIPAMVQFVQRLRSEPAFLASLGQSALRFSREHGQLGRALKTWRDLLAPLIPLAAQGAAETPLTSS